MLKFECNICHKVYAGWAVKYKYEGRCPVCGSELREVCNNYEEKQRIEDKERISNMINKKRRKKYRKVEGYDKEDSEDSLSKLLRLDI
ncbi:hypothetical protein ES705_50645 [subsurface metagenome]